MTDENNIIEVPEEELNEVVEAAEEVAEAATDIAEEIHAEIGNQPMYAEINEPIETPTPIPTPVYSVAPTMTAKEARKAAKAAAKAAGTNAAAATREAQKGKKGGFGTVMMIICLVAAVGLIAYALWSGGYFNKKNPEESKQESVIDSREDSKQESIEDSKRESEISQTEESKTPVVNHDVGLTFVEIVDKAAPSVVEITTEYVTTGSFMNQYIESGAGSGIVYSEDGLIITNYHVIEGADNIVVRLTNGDEYTAVIVGLDDTQDVALLKINATGLKPASFGKSSALKVGQEVVAIGNPLGSLGGTVTNGIISALSREITIEGVDMTLLQTNAAINPGNSGGGLFDANGDLIGITNAKYLDTGIEGLAFAIPIDDVVAILPDLIEYGYTRGQVYFGMTLLDIDTEYAARRYRVNALGCYVYSVEKGCCADEAGLKSGDLVLKVNGKDVKYYESIKEITDEIKVDDTVIWTISRNGTEMELTMVAGEYIPKEVRDGRLKDAESAE